VRLLLNKKELLGTSGTSSAVTVLTGSGVFSGLSSPGLSLISFRFFFAFFFSFLFKASFCFCLFLFLDCFFFLASSAEDSLSDSVSDDEPESEFEQLSESSFVLAFFFTVFFSAAFALALGMSSPQLLIFTSKRGRLLSSTLWFSISDTIS